jgi:hypothetical protein
MKGKVNQPSGIDTSDATAAAGDILATKTAYLAAGTKETGTLALTGDAVVADVAAGKTFYKDDAKTKLTGTLSQNPSKGTQDYTSAGSNDFTVPAGVNRILAAVWGGGGSGGTAAGANLAGGGGGGGTFTLSMIPVVPAEVLTCIVGASDENSMVKRGGTLLALGGSGYAGSGDGTGGAAKAAAAIAGDIMASGGGGAGGARTSGFSSGGGGGGGGIRGDGGAGSGKVAGIGSAALGLFTLAGAGAAGADNEVATVGNIPSGGGAGGSAGGGIPRAGAAGGRGKISLWW